MQFLADMLGAPVDRPPELETTARGVAHLAGWQAGLYAGPEEFVRASCPARFESAMSETEHTRRYPGWRDAVACSLVKSADSYTHPVLMNPGNAGRAIKCPGASSRCWDAGSGTSSALATSDATLGRAGRCASSIFVLASWTAVGCQSGSRRARVLLR